MPTLGPWELIVILLIVVVIFGAGRLSEVGGAVGKSIREFRKATTDEQHAKEAAAADDQLGKGNARLPTGQEFVIKTSAGAKDIADA